MNHYILKFWKHILILKYSTIKSCVKILITIFRTTYSCKSFYLLIIIIIKSKYRLNLKIAISHNYLELFLHHSNQTLSSQKKKKNHTNKYSKF